MWLHVSYTTSRCGSTSRPQHEAEIDGVFNALDFVDNKDLLNAVHFVAEKLDLLPKYGPEKINICAVIDRQRIADGQIVDLSCHMSDLENTADISTIGSMATDCLRELDKKVSALPDRINNTNSAIGVFSNQINDVCGPPARSQMEADLSMNLVISGVEEHRDPQLWRGRIDEILKHITGRSVDIADLYERTQSPSPCDRQTSFSIGSSTHSCGTLQTEELSTGQHFCQPDEALDVRQKKTLTD